MLLEAEDRPHNEHSAGRGRQDKATKCDDDKQKKITGPLTIEYGDERKRPRDIFILGLSISAFVAILIRLG